MDPVRHRCTVCHSHKDAEDFPLTTSGELSTATCRACLESTLKSAKSWEDLGLQPPPGQAPRPKCKRKRADPWLPRKRPRAPKIEKPTGPPPPITCRICVEEKDATEFVKYTNKKDKSSDLPFGCVKHLCRLPRRANDPVCKPCIGASLAASLDAVGAHNLHCLEPGCDVDWTWEYLSKYLPAESQSKYHEQMFQSFVLDSPTLTCPNKDCGAISLIERERSPGFPHLSCPSCKTRVCGLCSVPWHAGLSCQEYRATNAEDMVSREEETALKHLKKIGAKRCPRCQMAIEKDGGCNHMYCYHCHRDFDWSAAEEIVSVAATKSKVKAKEKAQAKAKAKEKNQERQGTNTGPLAPPPFIFGREVCEEDARANPQPPPPPFVPGQGMPLNVQQLPFPPPPPPQPQILPPGVAPPQPMPLPVLVPVPARPANPRRGRQVQRPPPALLHPVVANWLD